MRRASSTFGLMALCVALLAAASGKSTPPAQAAPLVVLANLITDGAYAGLWLLTPIPARGTTLTVRVPINHTLQANGKIVRRPGDATAFFTGKFGRKRIARIPTLPLPDQPRDLVTLSDGIVLIHSSTSAIPSPHREVREELQAAATQLLAAFTAVRDSGRPQPLRDQATGEIATAVVSTQQALDFVSRLPNRPTARQKAALIQRIAAAVHAAQIPFRTLAAAGLNPGFDVLLQDDARPADKLQMNTGTGDYRFLCNTTFTGRGSVTHTGTVYTLTDADADGSATVRVDTGTGSGSASLEVPVGTTRCAITDANYRNDTLPSPF